MSIATARRVVALPATASQPLFLSALKATLVLPTVMFDFAMISSAGSRYLSLHSDLTHLCPVFALFHSNCLAFRALVRGCASPYAAHPMGRSGLGDIVLIRATLVRAIFLSIAFFGTLPPTRGLAEDGSRLPTKANEELPRQLLSLLLQRNMPKRSPILIRIFKEELSSKSGSRTPPAVSSCSGSIRSAAGRAISARRSTRVTVRHPRASI